MDFDKVASHRTRNLMPTINSRLTAKKKSKPLFGGSLRFTIPTLALLFLGYMFIFQFDSPTDDPQAVFSKSDTEEIYSNINTEDDIDSIMVDSSIPELNSEALEDLASEEDLDNALESSFIESIESNSSQSLAELADDMSTDEIIDGIANWDEDDFQELIKEIQNANVNS
jgi:hypothetical protein